MSGTWNNMKSNQKFAPILTVCLLVNNKMGVQRFRGLFRKNTQDFPKKYHHCCIGHPQKLDLKHFRYAVLDILSLPNICNEHFCSSCRTKLNIITTIFLICPGTIFLFAFQHESECRCVTSHNPHLTTILTKN